MKGCMIVLGGMAVIAAGFALWIFGYQADRADSQYRAREAMARVQVGMTRAEAEQALSGAWYGDTCTADGAKDDLFFFGSRDVNRAGVVLLRFQEAEGQERVASVSEVGRDTLRSYDCPNLDLSRVGQPF